MFSSANILQIAGCSSPSCIILVLAMFLAISSPISPSQNNSTLVPRASRLAVQLFGIYAVLLPL